MSDGEENGDNTKTNGDDKNYGESSINNINIKLQKFWSFCPAAWFVSAENEFKLRRIKSDTNKFQCVVAALPQDAILSVLDVIKDPPTINMYDKLKEVLVERHSLSEEKRLDSLLSKTDMGDRRPSEFFRHLELLAGPDTFNRDLLVKLWMARLPKTCNIALMGSEKKDIVELLRLADRIYDACGISNIAAIGPAPSKPSSEGNLSNAVATMCTAVTEMCQRFRGLELEISELRSSFNNRPSEHQSNY